MNISKVTLAARLSQHPSFPTGYRVLLAGTPLTLIFSNPGTDWADATATQGSFPRALIALYRNLQYSGQN